jgi:hypothetical protein
MAPRFDLTSTAPGQARIVIDGLAITAKDKGLDLAVQRGSDEKYIGSGADWQNEPYWHRLEMLPDPANRSFRVGTDIVNALVQCYRADSFRASARWQGGQGDASLRINGELMGSDARLTSVGETPEFDLTSTTPGYARIRINGLAIPAKDKGLDCAIQRCSDEKYIGSGVDWQNERYWHRLEMLPDPANRSFRVGTDIVNALVQCYRADSFRASARWHGGQGDARLRINGEIIGSDTRLLPPGETPGLPLWKRVPRRWALLAGVAGLGIAVVVAAGALWLGALPNGQVQTTAHAPAETGTAPAPADPGTAQTPSVPDPAAEGAGQVTGTAATPAGPQETQTDGEKDLQIIRDPPPPNDQGAQTPGPGGSDSPSGGMTASEPAPAPYDAPQLKGPEYVSWLVDQAPDAATYQAQAERRASQGDCPAVILLYDRAARTNPEVAAQVARLYDPVGFQPSPCITQPSPNNAREYYELAAEGGVPAAQPALDALRTQGQPRPAIRTWENRQ